MASRKVRAGTIYFSVPAGCFDADRARWMGRFHAPFETLAGRHAGADPPASPVCSDVVVLVGNADDVAHVIVIVFVVGLEEGVVVVALDLDIVVAEIRQIVAARGLSSASSSETSSTSVFSVSTSLTSSSSSSRHLGDGGLLEEGQRIGLARVGGDDRITVQIVEFAPRFRVDALCSKFRFCHSQSLLNGRRAGSCRKAGG